MMSGPSGDDAVDAPAADADAADEVASPCVGAAAAEGAAASPDANVTPPKRTRSPPGGAAAARVGATPPSSGSARPRADLEAQLARIAAMSEAREKLRREKFEAAANAAASQPAQTQTEHLSICAGNGSVIMKVCITDMTLCSDVMSQCPAGVELTVNDAVILPAERIHPHAVRSGFNVVVRRKRDVNWDDHLDIVFPSLDQ